MIFKSRTVWVVIIALALSTLQTVHDLLPEDLFLLIESVLSALAIYFRVNARQNFDVVE